MQKRLQNGWPLEEAVSREHVPAARSWDYKEVHYRSFKELYAEVKPKCSYNSFRRYINDGDSIEEAATRIPSHGHDKGVVYVLTNTVTKKQYVGITTESADTRFDRHVAGASSHKHKNPNGLAAAIREYGADAFKVETIASADNVGELGKLEKHYIESYGTIVPDGYNISAGGSIGKPKGQKTTVLGKRFSSLKAAAEYLASVKNISYTAAEKRISSGRVDVESGGKPVMVRAYGKDFASKADLRRYMVQQKIAPTEASASHKIYRGQVELEELE